MGNKIQNSPHKSADSTPHSHPSDNEQSASTTARPLSHYNSRNEDVLGNSNSEDNITKCRPDEEKDNLEPDLSIFQTLKMGNKIQNSRRKSADTPPLSHLSDDEQSALTSAGPLTQDNQRNEDVSGKENSGITHGCNMTECGQNEETNQFKPDLSIFQTIDIVNNNLTSSSCPSHASKCIVIQRLLTSLLYYEHVNDQVLFSNFMDNIYKSVVYDDFYHLTKYHQNEFKFITVTFL